jgi:acetoin utilization protein AcuB
MSGSNTPGDEAPNVLVKQYMTSPPETLSSTDSLADAYMLLRRVNFRHIPIVDDHRLVGVLTDRDVARYVPSILSELPRDEYNRVLTSTKVGQVMAREPHCTTPESTVVEAAGTMHSFSVGCLPVMEGDVLVGIITVSDMLVALCDALAGRGAANPA